MENNNNSNIYKNYTNEELSQRLQTLCTECGEINWRNGNPNFEHTRRQRELEIIQLLHEYNEIKDATQRMLGIHANINEITLKEAHLKYDLPLHE